MDTDKYIRFSSLEGYFDFEDAFVERVLVDLAEVDGEGFLEVSFFPEGDSAFFEFVFFFVVFFSIFFSNLYIVKLRIIAKIPARMQ